MAPELILELVARGAASGMSLLLAVTFIGLKNGSWAARLGCLFGLSIAAYSLVSSDTISAVIGPANYLLNALAIPSSVFFWWFATSLFDDAFRWRWWRIAPLGLVILLSGFHFLSPEGSAIRIASLAAWQTGVALLMGHAALLALMELKDDLVEPRRKFRVTLAALVGLVGVVLGLTEIIYAGTPMPPVVFQLQAGMLVVLTLFFSAWAGHVRAALFVARPDATQVQSGYDRSPGVLPEDRALARRLEQAMQDGLYREPGLTVGSLAAQVKGPEHRLRKLINQGLGYRNFSSFLNQHRIADAQTALADPEHSREQILTIALDLGYGSIAPFNRAFREHTGTTPTAFRRTALAQSD